MNLKETKAQLLNFSSKLNLIEHAKETCMAAINNCVKENGHEEIRNNKIEDLLITFDKQSLIFNNDFGNDLFIKTKLLISIKSPDHTIMGKSDVIGYYELDTDEEGNHFDDWLIFE